MILGPFSARPPSVELIDQEPATRRQATVVKFNLTRRNARFQGETPTSICIACETSPRVLSRRPAGTTRCESSSKARWLACGRGSVGRASPCQGEGRAFESPRPLQSDLQRARSSDRAFLFSAPGPPPDRKGDRARESPGPLRLECGKARRRPGLSCFWTAAGRRVASSPAVIAPAPRRRSGAPGQPRSPGS